MKTRPASISARATLGALFFIIAISFAFVAFLPNESSSAPRRSGARVQARASLAPAVAATPIPAAPLPAMPQYIGFENFEGPGVLTKVVTSQQGGAPNSVEYIAHDAGEPSIGVNWNTNVTAFQSDLQTLFVTFNDNCQSVTPKATWVNRPAPTSQGADQDPIGFTDRVTGRTFAAQLTLTSPTCKTSYTDDDGNTWVPTAGFGIGSGIDHQTIGGGPYALPLPSPNPVPTPGSVLRAYYYCSQLPQAACARSDDGGLTFGPVVPIDPILDANCVGIHGHVKVGGDGTVYVPTFNCNGHGSVIVSENNGLTWTIRHVDPTTSGSNIVDAQVAIDDNNKLYFAMSSNTATGSAAIVATSVDHGVNFTNVWDIGAIYGVKNVAYPYVTAASPGRAAVAFVGTTQANQTLPPAGWSDNGFRGVWHLYVAVTYDGGSTWTTTDATPNDPMQRGCIWAQGGANICRNLLDFIGMTTDKNGRIEVAYVDGCPDGNCAQAVSSATRFTGNAYTARGVIARQSSGKRLIAAMDPNTPATSAPGMPLITARRLNGVVHLAWSEADSGNLMINNYQILRGTASGAEAPLTVVAGNQTGGSYDDFNATDNSKTYYYKVVAVNSAGSSCPNNELAVPYVGDTCTGFIVQKNPPNHPEQTTQGQTPPSLAIDYIAVSEPPNTTNLVFTMKVTNLNMVPPNSRWRIVWNWEGATGQQYYVGMRTDQNSAATFDYGHVATAVVGLVLGVPTETKEGNAAGGSGFNADGTITVVVPKSAVGNPQPGDLLGAVNGRTFTGDTPETNTLERSNLMMDHTFAKAQRDNGHPAATYMLTGNTSCTPPATIVPVSAVSRKRHNTTDYDVDLPLTGGEGIECRTGGPNGDHKIVVTFPTPVTVASATCGGQPAASVTGSGSAVVTVNCTGVPNAQHVPINLVGVNNGTTTANVTIPMGVLAGDTNADGSVNSADISQTKSQSGQALSPDDFREDVNVDGAINSADISLVKSKSGTALP